MTPTRLLTVVLLSVLGCLLAVGVAWRPTEAGPRVAPVAADRVVLLRVLADWDRARAAAWRHGDLTALRSLYDAGSVAGRADRALLAAYAARGLRVTGIRMQRAAVHVVAADADRIVLEVTDRVVGATAVGPDGRVGLPRDDWSRRRVVLAAAGDGWRVVEVRDVSAARPPAPT